MPPQSMVDASNLAIKELEEKMRNDAQFAASMRWLADFWRRWYGAAGYKVICQWWRSIAGN